jgi:hypothetical protein
MGCSKEVWAEESARCVKAVRWLTTLQYDGTRLEHLHHFAAGEESGDRQLNPQISAARESRLADLVPRTVFLQLEIESKCQHTHTHLSLRSRNTQPWSQSTPAHLMIGLNRPRYCSVSIPCTSGTFRLYPLPCTHETRTLKVPTQKFHSVSPASSRQVSEVALHARRHAALHVHAAAFAG